jgi:hypothetical protein
MGLETLPLFPSGVMCWATFISDTESVKVMRTSDKMLCLPEIKKLEKVTVSLNTGLVSLYFVVSFDQ